MWVWSAGTAVARTKLMLVEMPGEGEKPSTAEPGQPMQRQKHRSVAGGSPCVSESLDEPSNVTAVTSLASRGSVSNSQGRDDPSTAVNSNAATTLLMLAPARM